MFEDFASSGRGPGLMGMLLALLVLAGFSGMAIAVFYEEGGEKEMDLAANISSNKADIQIKKDTLIGLEEKLTVFRSYRELETEVTVLERRIKQETEEQAKLTEAKTTTLSSLEGEHQALVDYRKQYRVAERERAVGEIIDLSETQGPTFKDVKILGISALNLRVRTSSGPKGVPFEELPVQIQDRFQFSEEEAKAFKVNLAAANKVKDAKIAKFQAGMAEKAKDRKAANKIARIKFINNEVIKLTDFAGKMRNKAAEYEQRARQHLEADKAARRAKRMSMEKGLAREDANKAKKYASQANKAQLEADKLSKELLQLSQ